MGDAHFLWLQAASELGMKPMEALHVCYEPYGSRLSRRQRPRHPRARQARDLVVLDRNPLDDPRHYRNIHLVMKGGQVVDREALPRPEIFTVYANE